VVGKKKMKKIRKEELSRKKLDEAQEDYAEWYERVDALWE